MTSDNDTDWAYVPDHRMRVAHQPTTLRIQTGLVEGSAPLPVVREAPPTAEVAKQQPESAPDNGPKVSTDRPPSPPSTFKSKSSDTGWLRDLTITQVAINLPKMLEAEACTDDNATRVEIAIRLGRVVLRRKHNKMNKSVTLRPGPKRQSGLNTAIETVEAAIRKRKGKDGLLLRAGLNGTDSSGWIQQVLLGTCRNGRIKDHLMGKPHLPFADRAGSESEGPDADVP
jgi:hypothetical protein